MDEADREANPSCQMKCLQVQVVIMIEIIHYVDKVLLVILNQKLVIIENFVLEMS